MKRISSRVWVWPMVVSSILVLHGMWQGYIETVLTGIWVGTGVVAAVCACSLLSMVGSRLSRAKSETSHASRARLMWAGALATIGESGSLPFALLACVSAIMGAIVGAAGVVASCAATVAFLAAAIRLPWLPWIPVVLMGLLYVGSTFGMLRERVGLWNWFALLWMLLWMLAWDSVGIVAEGGIATLVTKLAMPLVGVGAACGVVCGLVLASPIALTNSPGAGVVALFVVTVAISGGIWAGTGVIQAIFSRLQVRDLHTIGLISLVGAVLLTFVRSNVISTAALAFATGLAVSKIPGIIPRYVYGSIIASSLVSLGTIWPLVYDSWIEYRDRVRKRDQ